MINPVTITPKALAEIKNILESKNIPDEYGLRIGVKGGGCGVSFILGFDRKKENDLEYVIEDVPVYVEKKQVMFLIGKEVDFYSGSDAQGFFFNDAGSTAGEQ